MEWFAENFAALWSGLLYPLGRLIVFMCVGLLLANLLEAMHWTRFMARLAAPLVRYAHLSEVSGAAFSTAFFSPGAANALLSESHEKGLLTRRELILSNLFNSSPAFFVHLPTMTSLVVSFLGLAGLYYVGICFLAACLRTLLTALCSRLVLSAGGAAPDLAKGSRPEEKPSFRELAARIGKRFKKRFGKIIVFTVPVYVLFFIMQKLGWFGVVQDFLAAHASALSFLKPEALGIVALHLAAELGAALSAAAAVVHTGGLEVRDVTLALLAGNILSTPVRAFRHQLPSYAGYYSPRLALLLVGANQSLRAATMILLTIIYYFLMF